MKRFVITLALLLGAVAPAVAEPKETRLYEMRVYTAGEGKLDMLHAAFRGQIVKLYEKHGITNVAYFVPVENKENKLYFLTSHANMDGRTKARAALSADAEFTKIVDGFRAENIVTKVEETFLTTTDFSPTIDIAKADPKAESGRVFELRLYTTTPGNLGNLDARFRDHTLKLFEKYGMTNLWYFHIAAGTKSPAGEEATSLIYLLAHKSAEARNKSFDDFREDADWNAARVASEKKGGGSLTTKDGVKSVVLKPTDYSPLK